MTAKTIASPVIAVVVVDTEEAGKPASQVTLLHKNQTATPMGFHRTPQEAFAAAAVLERLIEADERQNGWLKHGFDLKVIAPGCYAASKAVAGLEFLVSDEKESLALPEHGPLTVVAYGPNGEDTGFIRQNVTLDEIVRGIDGWAEAIILSNA